MQLWRMNQLRACAVVLGLSAAGGLALAGPAQAQQSSSSQPQTGSRYQVLVPVPEHPDGTDDDFGKDMADQLRKSIDKLPRHVSVSKDELKDNLRKYKLKEEELDCIKARQLAVQMNAELVMCGKYEPTQGGMKVSASFVGARNGETFEVPPFTAATSDDAAQKVFTAFSNYIDQLQQLAFCQEYLGSSQWANALQNCNKALEVNPNSPTGLYGRARALMEMDSLPAAYESLQGAIKANPMYQDALRAAGVVAAKLDKPEESRKYFQQYLELNPGAANVRISLANDAAKAGDPLGALKMVEAGFKNDTTAPNPDLLMYAGLWAQQAAQDAAKAGKDSTHASQDTLTAGAAPTSALADSLENVALGYYQKLYAAKDTAIDPNVLRNMAVILTKQGKTQQAVEIGQKMIAAKAQDPIAWSVYADALNAAGQFDQAIAALDSAGKYDTKGEIPVYAKKGQWLAQKGQLAEAKAALQQAVQRNLVKADDAANLIFATGYNQKYDKGDTDAALEYFAAARDLAESPALKSRSSFFTGYIYFQRGANEAKAHPKTPSKEAANLFRQALTYFAQADAYAATQSGIKSQIAQMEDYANKYIDAVKKASR